MRRCLIVLFAALAAAVVVSVTGCGKGSAPEPLEELPPATLFAGETFRLDPFECASAVLIDAEGGHVLFEQNADAPRAPASIVKMTLELVVAELVRQGEISFSDSVRASAWASRIGGSQVYLKEGETFPLRDLMKAIAISSANDACVAVAEHAAGDVDVFVDMMNRRVGELGLKTTHYFNVHGLDDEPRELNVTTAREVAMIGREIVRHPEVLEWSSLAREPFRNGSFILENTNTLIGHFAGMDGIKTGYTERAGYNLCASAARDGMRYISVVMGADSRESCAKITTRLLSRAFAELKPVVATVRGRPVNDDLVSIKASSAKIKPVAAQDVRVLVSKSAKPVVEVKPIEMHPRAPLVAGSPVGEAAILVGGKEVARVPLVSDQAVKASRIRAFFASIIPG